MTLCTDVQGNYGLLESGHCWLPDQEQWRWEPESITVSAEELGQEVDSFLEGTSKHSSGRSLGQWASNGVNYLCHLPGQGSTTLCMRFVRPQVEAHPVNKRQNSKSEQPTEAEESSSGLNTEQIVGIVFGSAATVLLIVFIIVCIKTGGADTVMGILMGFCI